MTWNVDAPDRGVLFVVSGPSGVGKTTLVRRALAHVPGLEFSVSATTRAPRAGEQDGVQYHFVTPERFLELVEAGAFLEHASVYGRSYGTLREPVVSRLAAGGSILLDIDVLGAAQVRRHLPDSVHVFVLPPSFAELETRLRGRGTDKDDVVQKRMEDAATQLRGAPHYDYVVVNHDLGTAHQVFEAILVAELSKVARRRDSVARLLESLPHRGSPTR
jgi:guanylate kinase